MFDVWTMFVVWCSDDVWCLMFDVWCLQLSRVVVSGSCLSCLGQLSRAVVSGSCPGQLSRAVVSGRRLWEFAQPHVLAQSVQKPLFSGLGEAGGVNFGCRGEKMRFPWFFIFCTKLRFWSFLKNGRGLTTILGKPAKTCPIHDPRWGKMGILWNNWKYRAKNWIFLGKHGKSCK